MKKTSRKVWSFAVILVMLISLLGTVAFAETAVAAMTLNTPVAVTITEAHDHPVELTFTPAKSGNYIFYSNSDDGIDPYADLVNAESGWSLGYDDDSGEGLEFTLGASLTADTTYILSCNGYQEGSYSVAVIESPIASIAVEDYSIIEGTDYFYTSDYDPELGNTDPYLHYEIYDVSFAVTFKDGTVKKSKNSEVKYDGIVYRLNDFDDNQCYTNQWTVGNSYDVTADFYGLEDTFKVSIVETPVASVKVETTYLAEGVSGWTAYDDETGNTYFTYYVNAPAYTVTLKDGTVLQSADGSVYYNGKFYGCTLDSEQDYANRWLLGGTYNIPLSVMNITVDAEVKIVEDPFVAAEVSDLSIVEGTHCWESYVYDDETQQEFSYTYYEILPTYTVTLKDGSVLESDAYGFVKYLGTRYYLDCWGEQSYETPWTVGNTYDAFGYLGNVEVEFKVSIVPFPFTDVAETAYYYDPVLYALEWNITTGTTATAFSPAAFCNRAQIVTFMWRDAGCPEPQSTEMPFTDVPQNAYYYDAVLWAVENGITSGKSATLFAPSEVCNRAQSVTFLWRYMGEMESDESVDFADVKADAYYEDAVRWAVEDNITNGTSATTFSPSNSCSRAQIVTFLYRCWN